MKLSQPTLTLGATLLVGTLFLTACSSSGGAEANASGDSDSPSPSQQASSQTATHSPQALELKKGPISTGELEIREPYIASITINPLESQVEKHDFHDGKVFVTVGSSIKDSDGDEVYGSITVKDANPEDIYKKGLYDEYFILTPVWRLDGGFCPKELQDLDSLDPDTNINYDDGITGKTLIQNDIVFRVFSDNYCTIQDFYLGGGDADWTKIEENTRETHVYMMRDNDDRFESGSLMGMTSEDGHRLVDYFSTPDAWTLDYRDISDDIIWSTTDDLGEIIQLS